MNDQPSVRLVDQRVRNRAIDALEVLARGVDGVREAGSVEYVEMFFDIVDDRWPARREASTYTPAEVAGGRGDAVLAVVRACGGCVKSLAAIGQ